MKHLLLVSLFCCSFALYSQPYSHLGNEDLQARLLGIDQTKTAYIIERTSLLNSLEIEPWESDSDFYIRQMNAFRTELTDLYHTFESARTNLGSIQLLETHELDVGEYQRNERIWPLSVVTSFDGLVPQGYEIVFDYQLAAGNLLRDQFTRFDNAQKNDDLRVVIDYGLSTHVDSPYYVLSQIRVRVMEQSTNHQFLEQVQKPTWLIGFHQESTLPLYGVGDTTSRGGQVFYVDLENDYPWNYLEVALDDIPLPHENPFQEIYAQLITWYASDVHGFYNDRTLRPAFADLEQAHGRLIRNNLKFSDFQRDFEPVIGPIVFDTIGAGHHNTQVMAQLDTPEQNPATLVLNQPIQGVRDWYIPSETELTLIFNSLQLEETEGFKGFVYASYLTSSGSSVLFRGTTAQRDNWQARAQFQRNYQNLRMRPIRAF